MAITAAHKLILNQLNDYVPSFRKGQVAAADGGDVQLGDLIEEAGAVTASEIAIPSGDLLIGTAGGVGAAQTMSGDATLSAAGVLTNAALSVEGTMLAGDAVSGADKIADDAVSLEHLDAGITPVLLGIAASGAATMSREENVAGLSSAIALAEAVRVTMDAHAADGSEHTTAADATNFPLTSPTATDLPTLLVLAGEMLTDYTAHNVDAQLGSSWAFHAAQQAGNDLVSAVTPTTLEEAVTRLNDLKAKYNTHEGSAVSHGSGSAHTEAQADAAYGAANLVSVSGALAGDIVMWSILDSGTGTVTGVSSTAGTDGVTFTFSADPQNDAIISYAAFRAAV